MLEEAKSVLGGKTYSETLEIALKEAIRAFRVRNLTTYFGTDIWEGDLDQMRGKPKKQPQPLSRKARAGK